MRKVLAAACFGLVLTVAGASSSDDSTPEGRAYFGLSFGGARAMPRDFHYGLRLDHDSRFIEGQAPAMMQLDFTTRGFNSAHVNGLNVIRPQYRLRQNDTGAEQPAEQPAEAPAEQPAEPPAEGVEEVPAEGGEEAAGAEQPGFFGRMWQGITGFFGGGDDEEEAPTETASTEPAPEDPAVEEVTEGVFLNFNAVDWGLLALGAVGIGYAVGEISNGDETDAGGTTTGGTTTGGTAGGTPLGGTPLGGTPLGLTPLGLTSTHIRDAMDRETLERIEWLDGGTGHMGDLEPHRAN
jgi:hypothetical protein